MASSGPSAGDSTPLRWRNSRLRQHHTVEEKLERQVSTYERKWPIIPRLSVEKLVQLLETSADAVLLLDVRTEQERHVSMIPTAIPLKSLMKYQQKLLDPDVAVVVYCTIGYRSGMEATRLLHRYPALDGRLFNLEGIVAYTYACNSTSTTKINAKINTKINTNTNSTVQEETAVGARNLVDPVTKKSTRRVHTFGSMWSLADGEYQPVYFSPPNLLLRLGQVGSRIVVRFVQRTVHYTRRGVLSVLVGCKRATTGTTTTTTGTTTTGTTTAGTTGSSGKME